MSERVKVALVSLGVLAAALVIAAGVGFFTLSQKKADHLSNWSNEKLSKELGPAQTTFDCTSLGLQGLTGSVYVDQKNGRAVFLCVVPG